MILHLVIGPADHGVVRFARRLAELTGGPVLYRPRPDLVTDRLLGPALDQVQAVHLQYTDALYAPRTSDAAARFLNLRRRLTVPVSVTLHDVPDPGDEPGRYRRRADSYARIAQNVDTVVVSSHHELELLQRLLPGGASAPRRRVVPLPIEAPHFVLPLRRPVPRPEVAVFGFIYPGKGHEDAIEAMAALPSTVSFVALGRPADGHDVLPASLRATAERSGRRLEITGFVADDRLTERMQQIAVPVVPARRISASGSINSWIAAGRRPLVADGPYPRELAERYPEGLRLYRPGRLPHLIRDTLAEPGTSWLETSPPPELTGPGVAEAYRVAVLGAERVGG